MLDYNAVKKFYANKLALDFDGTGRIESAFYHTMKMVYEAGVKDGEQAARHAEESRDRIVGVEGHKTHQHEWFITGGMAPDEKRCMQCGEWGKREGLKA